MKDDNFKKGGIVNIEGLRLLGNYNKYSPSEQILNGEQTRNMFKAIENLEEVTADKNCTLSSELKSIMKRVCLKNYE